MPPSSSPKGGSYLEELPAELILEIVSCLDVSSIKKLSLASSTLHRICFPALFQYLFFYDFGDRTPRRFLSDMRRRCPVPCVRKLSFNDLRADVKSQALLKWCAAVQEFEILSASNPKLYVPLLSGLRDLRAVELHRVTFQRVADFFELLRSLSATVKDLTIENTIEFVSTSDNYPILPQTGRRIKVEKLVVGSCLVLELLLRDDSPVELSRLKVAETRYVTPSIINKLGYLNPRLVKLVIQDPALESNSESLVLPTVKHLTLSFRLSEWRSTPLRKLLNHSEVNLEELTIKLPFEVILEERGEWEGLALMLSRQSKLQGLKVVALVKPSRKQSPQLSLNECRHLLVHQRRRILAILENSRFKVTMDVARQL